VLSCEGGSRRSRDGRADTDLLDGINDNGRTSVPGRPARRSTIPGCVRDDRFRRRILLAALLGG
jgi:hypothetical protein